MARTKTAAAATEPTIRVTLTPDQVEARRAELRDVRDLLAREQRELADCAGAIRKTRARIAELAARAERLTDALVTGEEDQRAQLELPAEAPAPARGWHVLRITQTNPAPRSELERLQGLDTEPVFEGPEGEARLAYADAVAAQGELESFVLYRPDGHIAAQTTATEQAKRGAKTRSAQKPKAAATGATKGERGVSPAEGATRAAASPTTHAILRAAMYEATDEQSLDLVWEGVVESNRKGELTDSQLADLDAYWNERQAEMRALERDRNGGELLDHDVALEAEADEECAKPPAAPPAVENADPEEIARLSGQKHVVVVRIGATWHRKHHGVTKGEAQTAWRRVKADARRLGRDARWYEHGAVVQRFDAGDPTSRRAARGAEASP